MLITTPLSEIEKYYNSPALNQSTLKELQGGLQAFLKKQEEEKKDKPYFRFGSVVDCILTGEEGDFDKLYYVSNLEKLPSDAEMQIVKYVFDNTEPQESLDLHRDFITNEAVVALDYYKGKPGGTRITTLINNCYAYYNELVLSSNKTILSSQEYQNILKVVESLRTNEHTRRFFDRELYDNKINSHIYYQVPIYFTDKETGIECKALIDGIIVNEFNGQVVVEPFDLKTMTGYTINFSTNCRSYRYDIQASFYIDAVVYIYNHIYQENYDYKIKPFKFVVESSNEPGIPLVFEDNGNFYIRGKYGIPEIKDSNTKTVLRKEIKGYYDLLKEYKYYSKTGWKTDILLKDYNGVLKLDWDDFKV